MEYIHLELAEHDVIWAEGAPSETYLDDGNRNLFHNAADWPGQHCRTAGGAYCAPRLTSGYELQQVRERIGQRRRRGMATAFPLSPA